MSSDSMSVGHARRNKQSINIKQERKKSFVELDSRVTRELGLELGLGLGLAIGSAFIRDLEQRVEGE